MSVPVATPADATVTVFTTSPHPAHVVDVPDPVAFFASNSKHALATGVHAGAVGAGVGAAVGVHLVATHASHCAPAGM